MPKSNVRFVAIWAAFVPIVIIAAALVPELKIEPWTTTQVTLVTAEVNAVSAVVLALVAYAWAHSVKEPAAVQGTLTALGVATLALGTGFGWWSLSDQATQLLVLLVGAVVVLVLTIFNRQTAYAPETFDAAVNDAKASALRGGDGTGAAAS